MRKICCDRPPERVWGTPDLTPLLPERSAIYGLAKCLPITKAGLSSNKDARIWTGQKVIFGVRTPVGIVAFGWMAKPGGIYPGFVFLDNFRYNESAFDLAVLCI